MTLNRRSLFKLLLAGIGGGRFVPAAAAEHKEPLVERDLARRSFTVTQYGRSVEVTDELLEDYDYAWLALPEGGVCGFPWEDQDAITDFMIRTGAFFTLKSRRDRDLRIERLEASLELQNLRERGQRTTKYTRFDSA